MTTTATRVDRLLTVAGWVKEDLGLGDLLVAMLSMPDARMPTVLSKSVPALQITDTALRIKVDATPQPVPQTAHHHYSVPRKLKNIGFNARVLRYLYTGPASKETLAGILQLSESEFEGNIRNLVVVRQLVEDTNGGLRLTAEGRKRAEWQFKYELLVQTMIERGQDQHFVEKILGPIRELEGERAQLQYCVDGVTPMKIWRGVVGKVSGDEFEFTMQGEDGEEIEMLSLYRVLAWRLMPIRRGPWHYTFMEEGKEETVPSVLTQKEEKPALQITDTALRIKQQVQVKDVTPQTAHHHYSVPRKLKNIGFTARVLRYLYTGPAYKQTLAELLQMPMNEFEGNIRNLVVVRQLVADNDDWLKLTAEGRRCAEWLVANPDRITMHSINGHGTGGGTGHGAAGVESTESRQGNLNL